VVITPFEILRIAARKFGDVNNASRIHCDAEGIDQLRTAGRAVVAAESVASHSGDHAVRDPADAVVSRVGDINAAKRVHGDAGGPVQLSAGGSIVVAVEACPPISAIVVITPFATFRMQLFTESAM
jgi:hypothetical protein